jgi:hypothetical protein
MGKTILHVGLPSSLLVLIDVHKLRWVRVPSIFFSRKNNTGRRGQQSASDKSKELDLHKCTNHDNICVVDDHTVDHMYVFEGRKTIYLFWLVSKEDS